MRIKLAPIEKLVIKTFLFILAIFIGMYIQESIEKSKQEQLYSNNR